MEIFFERLLQQMSGCEAMNGCLSCLAEDYPMVRFCKVRASSLGTSKEFVLSLIAQLLQFLTGQIFFRVPGVFPRCKLTEKGS